MELEVLSFTVGVITGGGFFGFGLAIGVLMKRDIFTRQVKDEEFNPDAEAMSEDAFEEQWSGDGEFPSDEVLQQLADLQRHSE
jgi:hypothetical protein